LKHRLRVGTRGSPLALAQTKLVVESLQNTEGGREFEVVVVRTSGDIMHDLGGTAVEGKRLFTREIEVSLLRGDIDIAVHSMKDLAAELPTGLTIAAVPERGEARDVLISGSGVKFKDLPQGARVGTSSPRRRAQLLAARRDLQIVDMHGNVDTRLRKLAQGENEAIVLAGAGLSRLGLDDRITEYLSTDLILPAVGQGALAIQTRESDDDVRKSVSQIEHEATHVAVQAERAFARRMGATCRLPIGAYARIESSRLVLEGMLSDPDGRKPIRDIVTSDAADPVGAGENLAERVMNTGGAALLG
jgi:hydroxymethylbilane synthase